MTEIVKGTKLIIAIYLTVHFLMQGDKVFLQDLFRQKFPFTEITWEDFLANQFGGFSSSRINTALFIVQKEGAFQSTLNSIYIKMILHVFYLV